MISAEKMKEINFLLYLIDCLDEGDSDHAMAAKDAIADYRTEQQAKRMGISWEQQL